MINSDLVLKTSLLQPGNTAVLTDLPLHLQTSKVLGAEKEVVDDSSIFVNTSKSEFSENKTYETSDFAENRPKDSPVMQHTECTSAGMEIEGVFQRPQSSAEVEVLKNSEGVGGVDVNVAPLKLQSDVMPKDKESVIELVTDGKLHEDVKAIEKIQNITGVRSDERDKKLELSERKLGDFDHAKSSLINTDLAQFECVEKSKNENELLLNMGFDDQERKRRSLIKRTSVRRDVKFKFKK